MRALLGAERRRGEVHGRRKQMRVQDMHSRLARMRCRGGRLHEREHLADDMRKLRQLLRRTISSVCRAIGMHRDVSGNDDQLQQLVRRHFCEPNELWRMREEVSRGVEWRPDVLEVAMLRHVSSRLRAL
jgi:hypothetical protein